ncbi:hypothetical protein TELCIR_03415 [Teladorsagia circumcincta]|uniref:EF-hand domain-containing protein n=1 Tax=Teladorsagia circumcincta TaxID=45464 RepID=A0A2G9UWM3_TELCI|nr:hypothetical protein TELCIR_03415 [Teladorsagia circumcincta]
MTTIAIIVAGSEEAHFGDHNLIHDAQHIKEHLKNKIDTNASTTEDQRLFHYFYINDLNLDGNLDGLEIMKSMVHSHDGHLAEVLTDEKVERLVDSTLSLIDLNRDGLIDFAEYMKRSKQQNPN